MVNFNQCSPISTSSHVSDLTPKCVLMSAAVPILGLLILEYFIK